MKKSKKSPKSGRWGGCTVPSCVGQTGGGVSVMLSCPRKCECALGAKKVRGHLLHPPRFRERTEDQRRLRTHKQILGQLITKYPELKAPNDRVGTSVRVG